MNVRLLQLRVRAFKIILAASKRRDCFFLLGYLQWKLINSLQATTYLGEKFHQRLLERSFRGIGLQTTIRQVVSSCPTYQLSNPKQLKDPSWPSLSNDVGPTQERTGRWTSPRCQFLKGINILLIMIDTFTGWIEGFPTQTEKAKEMVKNCSMKSF
jgi:hypothetical protein